ncbi:MAG: DUF664 domain-containing protein [Sphingobacteriales bacterium]|nr:MAG: DUF664 domain-containing protein [Sphingobacteriales bacterium]
MPFPLDPKYMKEAESELRVIFPSLYKSKMIEDNGGEAATEDESWSLFPFFDKSDNKRISRTCNHIVVGTTNAGELDNLPQEAVAIGENGCGDYLILRPVSPTETELSEIPYSWWSIMKKIFTLVLAVAITQLTFGQSKRMWTESDRDTLLNLIKDSKTKIIDATNGLSEEQLNFKPNDTSWSIKGVVEHLANWAEAYYWELTATVRLPLPQFLDSVRCDDRVFMNLADNPDKHVASDLFIPRDKYGDFQNTLKQYIIFEDVFSTFITNNKKNLREHFSVRPNKGVFDCRWRDAHQVVIVEIAHVYRHLKQIDRIKKHKNFLSTKYTFVFVCRTAQLLFLSTNFVNISSFDTDVYPKCLVSSGY